MTNWWGKDATYNLSPQMPLKSHTVARNAAIYNVELSPSDARCAEQIEISK